MSALDVFQYEGAELRTASLDGEPAVVLSDLAKLLGYRSASDAGRILRDHHRGYAEVRTPGGAQTMVVVTEQGMNRLLMRSNASNAEQVQDWLSDDVMPSIRRTGSYVTETPEQLMSRALVTAQAIIERKDEQIAVLAPRAEAWDELADAGTDFAVADAASILKRAGVDTGPQRLFDTLGEIGWTYRGERRRWRPYAKALDSGYLTERAMPPYRDHATGELVPAAPQVRITSRGLERLRVRLGALVLSN